VNLCGQVSGSIDAPAILWGSALKTSFYEGGDLWIDLGLPKRNPLVHRFCFPNSFRCKDFVSQATSGASILFPCIDFIPQGASIFVSTDYLQLRRFCFGNIPRCCAIFENFKQRQFHRFCLIVMIIPATLASTYLTHRFTYLECKDIYPLVI